MIRKIKTESKSSHKKELEWISPGVYIAQKEMVFSCFRLFSGAEVDIHIDGSINITLGKRVASNLCDPIVKDDNKILRLLNNPEYFKKE